MRSTRKICHAHLLHTRLLMFKLVLALVLVLVLVPALLVDTQIILVYVSVSASSNIIEWDILLFRLDPSARIGCMIAHIS
jgi:hypothetical protein